MRNFFSPRWLRRALGGIAAVAVLACQPKSPEEKLLQKAEPVGSWLASLEMAGQKWTANSVPTSFIRNSVAAARKELEKIGKEAAKSEARPELRAALRGLVSEARAAGTGLRRAVEANERGAVAREVGRLGTLRQKFEALTKGG